MFDPFENVRTCWTLLDRVGRCWIDFKVVQTFHPTSFQHLPSRDQNMTDNFVLSSTI